MAGKQREEHAVLIYNCLLRVDPRASRLGVLLFRNSDFAPLLSLNDEKSVKGRQNLAQNKPIAPFFSPSYHQP